MKRAIRHILAGGCGFVIDASLTHLLLLTGLSPFIARVPGILAATALVWLLTGNSTAGLSSQSAETGLFRYRVIIITSAMINYAVYALLIYRAPFLQPLVAIVAAWLAATIYSAFGHSRFAFRHKPSAET